MFAERTAAKTLATLAAEGSLRDHAFEAQLCGEKIGESLTPNSVPKCDPSFGVTIARLYYRAIKCRVPDPIFGVKQKAGF